MLPVVLLALVIFQALLGMWTVTHQLKPLVVTAHLLGGMATLSLLGWLAAREGGHGPGACAPPRTPWACGARRWRSPVVLSHDVVPERSAISAAVDEAGYTVTFPEGT